MAYKITLRKQAVKALEKINEPYYSGIKQAIYALAHNPRPQGCKKMATVSGLQITALSMIFLMMF